MMKHWPRFEVETVIKDGVAAKLYFDKTLCKQLLSTRYQKPYKEHLGRNSGSVIQIFSNLNFTVAASDE